ncbi:MAG: hypothetical protein HYW08_06115 [candidate division NC10 bacterium]|nr:hypothetical protein [candidate division NC10 bacterium]MBI2561958.1 hypothetical protein [candidate division NC10 bacterium]
MHRLRSGRPPSYSAAALVLAAVGLARWAGAVDVVFVPALVGFAGLAAYRAWRRRRMS